MQRQESLSLTATATYKPEEIESSEENQEEKSVEALDIDPDQLFTVTTAENIYSTARLNQGPISP